MAPTSNQAAGEPTARFLAVMKLDPGQALDFEPGLEAEFNTVLHRQSLGYAFARVLRTGLGRLTKEVVPLLSHRCGSKC